MMHFHFACLVVAVNAIAVVMASDATNEMAAIDKIALLDGRVTRDDAIPGSPVTGVDLRGSKRFNDKYVHLLKSFPSLSTLNLDDTAITDAGVREIGKLKNLRSLNLSRTAVSDEGLKGLNALHNLRSLILICPKITDTGLVEISRLNRLETLNLAKTSITKAGLQQLVRLPDLSKLSLAKTKVTGEIGNELRNYPSLTELDITDTDINLVQMEAIQNALPRLRGLDEMIASEKIEYLGGKVAKETDYDQTPACHVVEVSLIGRKKVVDRDLLLLKSFPKLAKLSLLGTSVTDEGLKTVSQLSQLADLNLGGTLITDAGISELNRLLSLSLICKCMIRRSRMQD